MVVFLQRHSHRFGHLGTRGCPPERACQFRLHFADLYVRLAYAPWQPVLFSDIVDDCAAHFCKGVCGKLDILTGVEPLEAVDEGNDALMPLVHFLQSDG